MKDPKDHDGDGSTSTASSNVSTISNSSLSVRVQDDVPAAAAASTTTAEAAAKCATIHRDTRRIDVHSCSGSTSSLETATVNESALLTTSSGGFSTSALATSSSPEHRGQWSSGVEFLLSCISMSVGLGNVWRFPYVAYKNGGGAFLIPYLLLLFVIGRPIYYFELVLGQFSGRGPIKIWKAVPALKGVGIAQIFSVSYVTIFYNYLMGISVFYFFASFTGTLPWTKCDESWMSSADAGFCSQNLNATHYDNKTWPELYYERTVLNQSTGLSDLNSISWRLVLCLMTSWALVYLSIVKGVTSLGKVAYFTAIFPYFVLITLLIVSLFQDGALEGIIYFITPQFEKLLDPIVWYAAVEQSFFSLAVCFGSLVMYSSYNDFNNNVKRDAVIISVLDTFTSLLAGFVIFAVLGAMAKENGVSIDSVVTKGTGLAFIAYPEGLSKIQWFPQLWSVLFFVMLFTLGIGSSVAMIETILTCFRDQFVGLQQHKGKTAGVACFIFMLLGLPLTTDAGPYIMSLLDNYGVGTAAFLYGILEITGFAWIYGLRNFCDDVEFMLKSRVSAIWRITWGWATPITLIVIFIYGNILMFSSDSSSSSTSGDEQLAFTIGWILAAIALIQIPLWAILVISQQKGATVWDRIRAAFKPTNDWGPIKEHHYNEWVKFKVEKSFQHDKQSLTNNFGSRRCKKGAIVQILSLSNGQKCKNGAKDNPAFMMDHNGNHFSSNSTTSSGASNC